MLSRLEARLQRLEQQRQGTDTARAQGLSGLLAYARAHHSEAVPVADLTDAELDAKIPALAGIRGLSLLLRQALEEERTRRQGAQGKAPLT
jgi:ATP/maltotriose-dependent transcriptional regulator MalT